MCFSAGASFIASGSLAAVGVLSVKQARKRRGLLAVAFVPILFSIQQLFEGIQWLLHQPSLCSDIFGYGFLFFAFLVWPVYVPWCAYLNEPSPKRKKLLLSLTLVGAVMSLVLFGTMMANPLNIYADGAHIVYDIMVPFPILGALVYGVVTIGALLLSTRTLFHWFALAVFLAYAISAVVYEAAFVSVWCFAAAILSGTLSFYIYQETTAKKRPKRGARSKA